GGMAFHKAVMGTAVTARAGLFAFYSLARLAENKTKQIWDNKYPNVDVFPWLLLSDLKTALVRGDDFSSGSSSRSTELIHGGVRYLQKAIMKLDYKQEPYFAICVNIRGSWSILSSRRVPLTPLSFVPPGGLNECELSGGQHNDARMNLAIALTAARYGAAIANYTEVVHLLKRADPQTGKERVCGAHCGDVITGQEFDVRAKCVINATGPFTDVLRKMDDQKNPDICQPSAGVHIVIPGYYSQPPVETPQPLATTTRRLSGSSVGMSGSEQVEMSATAEECHAVA
ncbi:hypothetical protein L3Q82_017438, partial [Scortum barcoo]